MSSKEESNSEDQSISRGVLKPAVSTFAQVAAGDVPGDPTGENLNKGNIKQIALICSGFVVCWVIISGVMEVYDEAVLQMGSYSSEEYYEPLPEIEYRQETLFESIFCSGAKRSTFCGS
jgi:hypothetical protein